jgi:hypothetical protein
MIDRVGACAPATVDSCSLAAIILSGALCAASSTSVAANFKCVDTAGKVSYQATPCSAAQTAFAVESPAASGARVQAPSISARPATREVTSRELAQVEADARGVREAWQRMVQATNRGDINAALRELTPNAQQRYRAVLESATKPDPPVRFDQLGEAHAVTVSGGTRATIKVTRKKADGIYAYNVMLLKSPNGRWLIDNM